MPAFVYHEVEAADFAADLDFLRCNGYSTLSTGEYVRQARGAIANQRAVLLTFDDARANFFEVALPILKQFNARATLFVPTYWIGEGRNVNSAEAPAQSEARLFMTWDQIRACRDSGLVDVQSHSHRHALVYISNQLVGFAMPERLECGHLYDWPMRRRGHRDILGRPPPGTPFYVAQPLLSASFRILEDPVAVRACQQLVADGGGAAYFQRSGWKKRLKSVHQAAAGRGMQRMEKQDFQSLLVSEFELSQKIFEMELGTAARYFAYPWMLGSADSLTAAARTGIEAVFGVGLDFHRAAKVAVFLPAFGRFKSDWLRFLPGHGRSKLSDVLPGKFSGLIRSQHLAH